MTESERTSAAEALQQRIHLLASTDSYRAYRTALAAVTEMQDWARDAVNSSYWSEELAGFDYMLDASPLLIDKLRHHMFHVTGLRVYDYRTGKDEMRERLARKLEMLLKLGDSSLLVPEASALGGFGFELDGSLYNVDTLKFFEAMLALDKGAVLAPLRKPRERRLVWEIGSGWGGFARVWKTVVPNTTYVIVDLPELFLFSGTYLATVFPDATIRYWAGHSAEELFRGWEGLDFIMVPAHALSEVRPPRADLTINMVSFQEMTSAQVQGYVQHAHAIQCPFVYSLNRDRSLYNTELSSVRDILAARFRLHEVLALDVPYTKLPGASSRRSALVERAISRARSPEANEYRHVIGWRRP